MVCWGRNLLSGGVVAEVEASNLDFGDAWSFLESIDYEARSFDYGEYAFAQEGTRTGDTIAGFTGTRLVFHRFDAAHDFGELGGYLALAGAVVLHRQRFHHLVGVVGGALHGDHASDVFAGRGVQETLE
jgi:hypothetical protein